MPALDAYLHYRLVDVSSIKELSRRWFPRAYFAAPAKHGGHRALADILESIEELRYYREAVFVPAPGPDSATAREIASAVRDPARRGRRRGRGGRRQHDGGGQRRPVDFSSRRAAHGGSWWV